MTSRPFIIIGPTSSGKSSLGLTLAHHFKGEIINADSQQVYEGLPILTAQPSPHDKAQIPHHLYGYVPLGKPYSVSEWIKDAQTKYSQHQEKNLFFVGGTGFYFKAMLEGLSPVPNIDEDIRTHTRLLTQTLNTEELYERLKIQDPAMAIRLKPSDTQRILRALEVILQTGKSLNEWQKLTPKKYDFGTPFIIAIMPEEESTRGNLHQNINMRTERMFCEGAVAEVEKLLHHYGENLPPKLPLGMREIIAHLHGALTLSETIKVIQEKTRQYAKRQMTWIRHQLHPHLILKESFQPPHWPFIWDKIQKKDKFKRINGAGKGI